MTAHPSTMTPHPQPAINVRRLKPLFIEPTTKHCTPEPCTPNPGRPRVAVEALRVPERVSLVPVQNTSNGAQEKNDLNKGPEPPRVRRSLNLNLSAGVVCSREDGRVTRDGDDATPGMSSHTESQPRTAQQRLKSRTRVHQKRPRSEQRTQGTATQVKKRSSV